MPGGDAPRWRGVQSGLVSAPALNTQNCAEKGFQSVPWDFRAAWIVDRHQRMTATVRTQALNVDLPPQCPKCGCHRVRVVGQPLESALRFMRCEDCESTSALLTRHRS